jgi:hypothetical protein
VAASLSIWLVVTSHYERQEIEMGSSRRLIGGIVVLAVVIFAGTARAGATQDTGKKGEANEKINQWLLKQGAALEEELVATNDALNGLGDKINAALEKSNDKINQWILDNGAELEKKAEETKTELLAMSKMLEQETESAEAELTQWLEENSAELRKLAKKESADIAKFEKKLAAAIEQAKADSNEEVATQASELSAMLGEVAGALESVSRHLADQ